MADQSLFYNNLVDTADHHAYLWFVARLHKTAPVSRNMILNYR